MDLKDVIALGLGLVGTVLGITNFVRSVMLDRVKLDVIPKFSWVIGGGRLNTTDLDLAQFNAYGLPTLALEIVNKSKFPVTLDEVGLTIHRTIRTKRSVLYPVMQGGERWPVRLEPRASTFLLFGSDALLTHSFGPKCRAYATTACGHTAYGKGSLLKLWAVVQADFLKKIK